MAREVQPLPNLADLILDKSKYSFTQSLGEEIVDFRILLIKSK